MRGEFQYNGLVGQLKMQKYDCKRLKLNGALLSATPDSEEPFLDRVCMQNRLTLLYTKLHATVRLLDVPCIRNYPWNVTLIS